MLRVSVIVQEFIEAGFHSTFDGWRAAKNKEEALKILKKQYEEAKNFLESNGEIS